MSLKLSLSFQCQLRIIYNCSKEQTEVKHKWNFQNFWVCHLLSKFFTCASKPSFESHHRSQQCNQSPHYSLLHCTLLSSGSSLLWSSLQPNFSLSHPSLPLLWSPLLSTFSPILSFPLYSHLESCQTPIMFLFWYALQKSFLQSRLSTNQSLGKMFAWFGTSRPIYDFYTYGNSVMFLEPSWFLLPK